MNRPLQRNIPIRCNGCDCTNYQPGGQPFHTKCICTHPQIDHRTVRDSVILADGKGGAVRISHNAWRDREVMRLNVEAAK